MKRLWILIAFLIAAVARADGPGLDRGALLPYFISTAQNTGATNAHYLMPPGQDFVFAAWVHASATLNTVGTAASNWTAQAAATTDYANNFAVHLWRHNGPTYDENPAFAYSATPTTAYYGRFQIGGSTKWGANAVDKFSCQVQSGTTFATPSVTTTTDGQQVIGLFAGRFTASPTWTPPASTTEWQDSSTGSNPNIIGMEMVDYLQPTAGSISFTATPSQSATTGVACILTIKKAANNNNPLPSHPTTSAIVGWVTKSATSANTYLNLGGPTSTNSTTEANRQWVAGTSGRISNLHCYAATAPSGANQTYVFYVRRDSGSAADTTVTCSPGAGGQSCSDTTHSVDYNRGDRIGVVSRNAITTTGTGSVVCTFKVDQNGGTAGHYSIYGSTSTDDVGSGQWTWRAWGTSDTTQGWINAYYGTTSPAIFGLEAMKMWGWRMYGAGQIVSLSEALNSDYLNSQHTYPYLGTVSAFADIWLGGASTRGGTNRTVYTDQCTQNSTCTYADDEQIGLLTRHTTRSYGQGTLVMETTSPQTVGTVAKLYRDASVSVKYIPILGDVTTAAQDAFRFPGAAAVGGLQVDVNTGHGYSVPQSMTIDFCSGSTFAGVTCGAANGKPSCTTSGATGLPLETSGSGRAQHACVDYTYTQVAAGDYAYFKVTNSASYINTLDYIKITVAALESAAAPPTSTPTPTITNTPLPTNTPTNTPTPTPMPTCKTPGMVVASSGVRNAGKCGVGLGSGTYGGVWGCSGGGFSEYSPTPVTSSKTILCDGDYVENTGHWGQTQCWGCEDYGFTVPADAEVKGVQVHIKQRRSIDASYVHGPIHISMDGGPYDNDLGYCPSYSLDAEACHDVPPEVLHYPPYGSWETVDFGWGYEQLPYYYDWKDAGHSWTDEEVNNTNFGPQMNWHIPYRGWNQLRIDCITAEVYYCAVPTETPTPGPTFTPTATPTITPTIDPLAPTATFTPSPTPTEVGGTPTRTKTSTPIGGVPTATPVRDEKVTTHRFQTSCGTFEAVTAGSKEERCLAWNIRGDAEALGSTAADYTAWCEVQSDATPVTIPVVVDRLVEQTTDQVCAVLFNRNAVTDQSGTWCCHAYRWGDSP